MKHRTLRSLLVSVTAAAIVVTGSLGLGVISASATTAYNDVVTINPVATWVPDLGLATAQNGLHSDGVHALAQDANWIYLGGDFTYLQNPVTHVKMFFNRLARISITTYAPDPNWTPTVDDDIRAMVLDPTTSTLYLGGDFANVDGTTRTRLAAVSTADSGSLKSWYPGAADNEVQSLIQLDSTTIMASGAFLHIGSLSRNHIVKVSTAGVIDTTFKPAINGAVYTMNHPAGASFIYIGGLFTTLSTVSHVYIGAVDTTAGAPTSWNPPNPCSTARPVTTKVCPVFSFVVTPTQIFAGSGGPGGRTTSFNPTSGAINWQVVSDGDNQALVMDNGELFVGGHFGPQFGPATGDADRRESLAAVNPANGKPTPWNPHAFNFYPGTWALMTLPDGSLVIGGDQAEIGGAMPPSSATSQETSSPYARFAIFPPVHTNVAPTASFTSSCGADTCTFNPSLSADSDGTIVSYAWTFGDGATTTTTTPTPAVTHQYATSGTKTVTLTVTDNAGATGTVTHTVSPVVAANPLAFVGVTDGSLGSTTTKVAATPAGTQLGDTLLAFFTAPSSANWTGLPASANGWTQLGSKPNGTTSVSTVWSKTVVTADLNNASEVSLSSSAAAFGKLTLAAYRGVSTTASPVVASGSDVTTATHISPSVTSRVGDLVVSYWSDKSTATSAWTLPTSVTRRDASFDTGSNRYSEVLADSGTPVPAGPYGPLTAVANATGSATEMFLISLPEGTTNQLPSASFTFNCVQGACSFNGSASHDTDGSIATYAWDFGDGNTETDTTSSTTHTYAATSTNTVKLTVTDNRGGQGTTSQSVSVTVPVNSPPVAAFTSNCSADPCTFDGGSSTDDGTIASYAWNFGDGTTGTGITTTHGYGAPGTYTVTLTVTDNQGATGTTSTPITPTVAPSAISYVGATHAQINSTVTKTVAVPANTQAGDTLLLYLDAPNTTSWTGVPAGWTSQGTVTSGAIKSQLWTKKAVAGDLGTSVTLTNGGTSAFTTLTMAAYRGVDTTNLVINSKGDVTTTTHVSPTVSAVKRSWVVTYWSDKSTGTTSMTIPSSLTPRQSIFDTGTTRFSSVIADSGQGVPTGTYGGLTATGNSTASATEMWTVAMPEAANVPPSAVFTPNCTDATCTFDSTGTVDTDGTIASYSWTFGDGGTSTAASPTHTYTSSNTWPVTLTVTDNKGATGTIEHDVPVTVPPPPPNPTASFTLSCVADTCSVDASASVANDPSGSITSYSWDFGDSTSGSGVTTSHTYTASGTPTITLTVTDDLGHQGTSSQVGTVTVQPNPTASFTLDCSGATCNVDASASAPNDPGGSITSYSWDFGDSSSGSGVTTSHTYTASGTPTITLTVTDDLGHQSTEQQPASVTVPPPPNPTAAFVLTCSGDTCNVNATSSVPNDPGGSITSYSWDYGDSTSGSGAIASHAYTASGTPTITLTVTDDLGHQGTSSQVGNVTVQPNPTASFTFNCTGATCNVDASASAPNDPGGSITSYSWDFGDSSSGSGVTTSHTYTASGTPTITLTVTDDLGHHATNAQGVSVTVPSITFVGASSVTGGATKTKSVTVPAGTVAGDQILLFLTTPTAANWGAPTGITGLVQVDSLTNASNVSTLWKKTAVAGDAGATITVTDTTATRYGALTVAVYHGVGASGPVAVKKGDVNTVTHVSPTVTSTAGSWVVSYWSDKSSATSGWTAPAGTTTRNTTFDTGGTRVSDLLVDSGGPVSAGTSGGLTAVANATGSATEMWTISLPSQ